MLVWVYTCQNATLLEITCRSSYISYNVWDDSLKHPQPNLENRWKYWCTFIKSSTLQLLDWINDKLVLENGCVFICSTKKANFVWFDSLFLSQQFFSYVGTGLPWLTQCSASSEAQIHIKQFYTIKMTSINRITSHRKGLDSRTF